MPRLLGLGDNTIDTYVDLGQQYPGGNCVNVAVLAHRLGAEAAYLGCIGNDEAGDMLRAALDAENIESSHCRNIAAPNARAFIRHNNGDRQFVRSEPGCRAEWGIFTPDDLAHIASFDLVHSSFFAGLEPHRTALRRHIRNWSFDFSEKWTAEILADWVPCLDAVFLSYPAGSETECSALAYVCAGLGARSVVITRGPRGAFALRDGETATIQPAQAQVVDTLGAGDAFIAAYLLADFAQQPLLSALTQAAVAAADACERFGAFGHGRPWDDLQTREVS